MGWQKEKQHHHAQIAERAGSRFNGRGGMMGGFRTVSFWNNANLAWCVFIFFFILHEIENIVEKQKDYSTINIKNTDVLYKGWTTAVN